MRPADSDPMRSADIASGRSFNPEICGAHHLAPFFHLQPDARTELVGGIGDRLEAKHREPLADVRLCNAFRDLAREQLDDLFRRPCRRYDAGQRVAS
jgi:hypothetical protein